MKKNKNETTEANNLSCPYDNDCPIKDQFSNAVAIANLGICEWDLSTDSVLLSEEAIVITGIDGTTFDGKMKTIIEENIHFESREE